MVQIQIKNGGLRRNYYGATLTNITSLSTFKLAHTIRNMAWGSGAFNSCDKLLERVEQNDPTLVELVILPMKLFGAKDIERLSNAIIGKFC